MDVFLIVLRLLLAAVFAVAAYGKLFDRPGTEKAFAEFGVPEFLRSPLASILPVAELAIALTLLFVSTSWLGAVGAATLLIVFLAGMFYQLATGNAPDCHCFGQLHSEPVGASSIIRNLVLLSIAGFLLGQGSAYQGLSLVNNYQDIMQFIVGLAVIGLLGAIVFLLKRISDQQLEIVKRIEVLEVVGHGEAAVERENVTHPHEGLPIGAVFPDFELPGINGDMVTLDVVRSAKMPSLFFFISPTCTPCRSLVPEFERWQVELKDKVNLVFVSSGTAEANEEKFGTNIVRQLILQKDRELAETARAKWTPTAIYVDQNGRVASHAAAGDSAIRDLVERISSADLKEEYIHFMIGDEGPSGDRIGQKVPEFSLTEANGRPVTSDVFTGKTTLVTFWGLECGHCKNMLEEFRDWDRSKSSSAPQVIVFSEGEAEANAALGFKSPVVLDQGYKAATDLGMFGTPSAVLVNEEGVIISETAIGAPDIWALAGRNGSVRSK
jgi:thiol-disulfide isomerase/thioredoxin